ncbi:MAG: MarR family transcriptional regulator [Alphaproteobacteria bacterium]|nr:MAG: MarR family transcriptional regulator [Alphaproteobacteria bacterium]
MPENKQRLKLGTFLPYRLSVLANNVSTAIASAYESRFGLSIPQWRVLAALAEREGQRAADIVQTIAMDKVTVSRAVNGLTAKQYVARRPARHDGRAAILSLTKDGWRVYEQIVPIALAYEAALLSPLSAEERAALDRLMTLLMQGARNLPRQEG